MVLLAFEAINDLNVEVLLTRVDTGAVSDLLVTVRGWSRKVEEQAPEPLVSTKLKCSAMNLRTLENAVIAALYQLDFQLAEQEFARVSKPECTAPRQ